MECRMKTIRKNTQFVGILALTLVCLSFTAAPASAMGVEFDGQATNEVSVRDQISDAFSTFQDRVVAFILDIGSIFAHQDGIGILD